MLNLILNAAIKTPADLTAATVSSYVYAAIIAVVCVLLMIVIANAIPSETGARDNSGKTRRIWFFLIMVIALIAPFIVDYFIYLRPTTAMNFINKYMMQMCISAVFSAVLYFVIGFAISKMQSTKNKLASIFPKKDR